MTYFYQRSSIILGSMNKGGIICHQLDQDHYHQEDQDLRVAVDAAAPTVEMAPVDVAPLQEEDDHA